jgi:hypothetical protein
VQAWLHSFHDDTPGALSKTSSGGDDVGFANIKSLLREKGPLEPYSMATTGTHSAFDHEIPKNQLFFPRQQPVPEALRRLVKHSLRDDQVHLIIQGLGPSGRETRDKIFPRNAPVTAIHDYLEKEGLALMSFLLKRLPN